MSRSLHLQTSIVHLAYLLPSTDSSVGRIALLNKGELIEPAGEKTKEPIIKNPRPSEAWSGRNLQLDHVMV